MSTRTAFSGTIFVVGIIALAAAWLGNNQDRFPATNKEDNAVIVRIEWNTLNHNYSTPKLQPFINWQVDVGGGNSAGNKPIMKSGTDSKTWTDVKKGRHILAWVSVDPLHTSRDAVQTVKIFINGEQKCGPGFNDQGVAQGGHNAICETIS